MDAAVARIEMAIAAGEKVLVHGDYDVDGLTGTALLVRTISDMGGDAHGFVPHRQRDGYDLGDAGLQHAADIGATLIVTTDCGTTAIGPIEQANGSGIDVVVTDHHRPAGTLPAALAVVNPAREDSDYPFAGLAGVGVAFKVASQLACNKGLAEEYVNQHLDLVALGTVAGAESSGFSRSCGQRTWRRRTDWTPRTSATGLVPGSTRWDGSAQPKSLWTFF